jgi:uncharacterized protein GlcG (DUF336 family)
MANVIQKNSISAELAQKMVDAALAKANAIGVPVNVAILDDGGNLKAFSRMDGAPILSIEIAQNKAYTALQWSTGRLHIQPKRHYLPDPVVWVGTEMFGAASRP